MRVLKFSIAAIVFFSVLLCAQSDEVKKMPGYFEFGNLASLDSGDEGTEVLIEEYLLKMVAKMSRREDKDLSALLEGLKLVKVNTFSVTDENEKDIKDKVKSIQTSLTRNNWDRIVRVREKGQDMNVYLKSDKQNKIDGLVVAGLGENKEAIFINIVGNIDLETIGKLGDKFDIPSLGDINKEKKNKAEQ